METSSRPEAQRQERIATKLVAGMQLWIMRCSLREMVRRFPRLFSLQSGVRYLSSCRSSGKPSSLRIVILQPISAMSRNYQHLDYHIFDSGYIESCGPFRFHPTDNLSVHLTITKNNEILFYANWKKWVSLARHKVLHEAAKQNRSGRKVGFDTIISTTRLKPEVTGYSPAFLRIAQDVLIMNLLCFRQPALLIIEGKKSRPQLHIKNAEQDKGKAVKFRNRRSHRTQVD